MLVGVQRLSWLLKIFGKKKEKKITLGIYGAPNVGKTTLANRIAKDCGVQPQGVVSEIPHETRVVEKIEKLHLNINGKILQITMLDMPGLATKIDYRDFLKYGLTEEEAIQRAKEATKGVIEAVKWLNKVDVAIAVVDSTKVPYDQVNIMLIGTLEAKGIPIIIAANKIDLAEARPHLVKETFPNHRVIPVSALTGKNIENLYETLSKLV